MKLSAGADREASSGESGGSRDERTVCPSPVPQRSPGFTWVPSTRESLLAA